MDKLYIHISEGDLIDGLPLNPGKCPIALAAKRILKNKEYEIDAISVDNNYIRIYTDNYKYETLRFVMPPKAVQFLMQYDGHGRGYTWYVYGQNYIINKFKGFKFVAPKDKNYTTRFYKT